MKKFLSGMLLLVFTLVPALAFANSDERLILVDGVAASSNAVVTSQELLIPAEVVKEYIYDIKIDTANNRVSFAAYLPRFSLETAALTKLVSGGGVELNVPLKKIAGRGYIDAYSLEKLLGFSIKNDDKAVTISTGAYTYFSQRPLNQVRKKTDFSGKINLVWDHITADSPSVAPEVKGLNVISPTWFSVASADGYVINKADRNYVRTAHEKGYKVWALVNNSFDKDLTRNMLTNAKARENVIKQLAVYASLYDLDGINIDFENMYDEDKDTFTQFVKELTTALKEQNITISIDTTVPAPTPFWSMCYDRGKLASIVDYVMVMTYDEHWRTSPVSGSVASIGWVEKGISATLQSVPKEKLLMGIPFYTRLWEESFEEGRLKVRSQALSMEQSERIIAANQATPVWLADKGQYYAEYQADGSRYRIWLEDEKSIALKAALVHKFDLAGTAAWRRGFEKPQIWNVLGTALKTPS